MQSSTASQSIRAHHVPPSPALWAHLLGKPVATSRKDDPKSSSLPSHAHITPADKAGTSTRILLHDTHARLEAFTDRVEKLLVTVEKGKREVELVGSGIQTEREKMADDIVQLVNRCQTSIQKSVGEPAQATAVVGLQSELAQVKEKLHGIDAKLDGLHITTQNLGQALQTLLDHQSRSQDQHTKMMELLAPLLPLLQAVPLHIDSSKSALSEKIYQVAMEVRQVAMSYTPGTTADHNGDPVRSSPLPSHTLRSTPPTTIIPTTHPSNKRRRGDQRSPGTGSQDAENDFMPSLASTDLTLTGPCSPGSRAAGNDLSPGQAALQTPTNRILVGHGPGRDRSQPLPLSTNAHRQQSPRFTPLRQPARKPTTQKLPNSPPCAYSTHRATPTTSAPSMNNRALVLGTSAPPNSPGVCVTSSDRTLSPTAFPPAAPTPRASHSFQQRPASHAPPSLRDRRMYGETISMNTNGKRFIVLEDDDYDDF